jgi:hypothetical protein
MKLKGTKALKISVLPHGSDNAGCFGHVDKKGRVKMDAWAMIDLRFLERLSIKYDRYVFKHRNGHYGYFDEKNKFVPVDVG